MKRTILSLLVIGVILLLLSLFPSGPTDAQPVVQATMTPTAFIYLPLVLKNWTCVPSLISPEEGAVLDNGRTDRLDDIVWDFDWSDCQGATQYHLYVIHSGAPYPVGPVIDDDTIGDSSYHSVCQGCYIIDQNRYGWTWKVRAKVDGQWGGWSETRTFDVEPVNSDPPSP